jgi:F-type H+-transporting ATPase subunit delta
MSRAAIRYAKAIYEIADAKGTTESVNQNMSSIREAISAHQDLQVFLENPTIKGESKLEVLSNTFKGVESQTLDLFRLLLVNKRFGILEAITFQYNVLFDKMNGIELAKVTTAIPMDANLEKQVLAKINEFSNNKITIENIVDPSIIGGFVIRMGDKQFNASIAHKLQQLKTEFSN